MARSREDEDRPGALSVAVAGGWRGLTLVVGAGRPRSLELVRAGAGGPARAAAR